MADPVDPGYYDAPPDMPPDPTVGLGGQPYIPMYGAQQGINGFGSYGDAAAYQTTLRAGYGNNPLFTMMGGFGAVGGGMASGAGDMLSAIGAHVRPLAYTPPAFVATSYAGHYIQQTGFMASLKNLVGVGPALRGARDYDIAQNAAGDIGERAGLAAGGIGLAGLEGIAGAIGGRFGLLPGFGAMYIASKGTDMVRKAVAERREVEGYLDLTSDRFITASSAPGLADQRKGTGFSVESRRQVAEYIRELDINDPLLNMQDLTKVLKGGVEAGVFTGTHDMQGFKKTFKDLVENVKVVATTLHQTLEEGVKTIRDLRGVGIDPSQARGVVLAAEAAGRVSGRTAGEMLNLGMQGAELFRGTGVTMQIGFESNMMNAAAIRSARDAGMISQEAIAQAGGEESMAQRMTATSLGFMQSGMGRGVAGAFLGGAGPGGFNVEAFNRFAGGGMDMGHLAGAAAQGLGSPSRLISFQANQAQFISEMGKQFGGQGLQIAQMSTAMSMATMMSRMTGTPMDDAFKFSLEQQGVDEQTATMMMARLKNAPNEFTANQRAAGQTRDAQMIQTAQQNFFISRIGAEIGDVVKAKVDIIAAPMNKMVDSFQTGVKDFADKEFYGIERFDLAGTGHEAFVGASSAGDVQAMRRDRGARRTGRIRAELETRFASATPGSELRDLIGTPDSIYAFDVSDRGDEVQVGSIGLTYESLERRARTAGVAGRTVMEAERAAADDKTGAVKAARERVSGKLMEIMQTTGDFSKITNLNDLTQRVFGKNVGDLQRGGAEYDALLLETKGTKSLRDLEERTQRESSVITSAFGAVGVSMMAQDAERARTAQAEIQSSVMGGPNHLAGFLAATGAGALVPMLGLTVGVHAAYAASKDADLTPDVVAQMALLNQAVNTPGADQTRIRNQLDKMIVGADLSGRRDQILASATATDQASTERFRNYLSSQAAIDAQNQIRGMDVLRSSLDREVSSPGDRDRLASVLDRVSAGGAGAVLELKDKAHEADMNLLKGMKSGTLLTHEADVLKAIKETSSGATPEEFGKAMSAAGVSGSMLQATQRAFAERGTGAALETYHAQTLDALAGQSGVSVAGAPAGIGSAAGTAQEQYAVQTSTNLQVLAIMTALAAKLGVH